MSELSVDLTWNRKESELLPGKFSSEHEVSYNENFKVTADTAPDWGGSSSNTNPEQALAASLSSCHMMTFLALAAKTKWPVSSYKDHAVGHLGKNSKKQMVVNRIDLNPGFKSIRLTTICFLLFLPKCPTAVSYTHLTLPTKRIV